MAGGWRVMKRMIRYNCSQTVRTSNPRVIIRICKLQECNYGG
jgi:hypothetical protein